MELLEYVVVLPNIGLQHQQAMKIRTSFFWFIAIVVVDCAGGLVCQKAASRDCHDGSRRIQRCKRQLHNTGHAGKRVIQPIRRRPSSSPRRLPSQPRCSATARQGAGVAQRNPFERTISRLVFYGRLEDQSGNPVGGAEIISSTYLNAMPWVSNTRLLSPAMPMAFLPYSRPRRARIWPSCPRRRAMRWPRLARRSATRI